MLDDDDDDVIYGERGASLPPLFGLGVLYHHFSGWKGEEFAVICCQ